MLGDLAIAYSHGIYGFEMNLASRCRNSEKHSPVGAVIRLESSDHIIVDALPVNLRMKVGERAAKRLIQLESPLFIRRAPRLRCVIHEIVGEHSGMGMEEVA